QPLGTGPRQAFQELIPKEGPPGLEESQYLAFQAAGRRGRPGPDPRHLPPAIPLEEGAGGQAAHLTAHPEPVPRAEEVLQPGPEEARGKGRQAGPEDRLPEGWGEKPPSEGDQGGLEILLQGRGRGLSKGGCPSRPFLAGPHPLPPEGQGLNLLEGHGFHGPAGRGQALPVDPPEELGRAPLLALDPFPESAPHQRALPSRSARSSASQAPWPRCAAASSKVKGPWWAAYRSASARRRAGPGLVAGSLSNKAAGTQAWARPGTQGASSGGRGRASPASSS